MITRVSNVLTKVKANSPLVHAITNYVTINDCANILLAYGASPAMVEASNEAFDFARISSSIYLNLGTLTQEQEAAAVEAARSARLYDVPVVLDPVGCGAIPRKSEVINKIFETGRIDIIKGNAGEIKFLAGMEAQNKGVDSIDNGDGLTDACINLAKKFNCIVIATGKEDVVTDGSRLAIIKNSVPMLTRITGAGCMLGALCAAAAAVEKDKFIAGVSAVVSMCLAGEMAYKESSLPGTFKCKLIDSIFLLSEEVIERDGIIEWM